MVDIPRDFAKPLDVMEPPGAGCLHSTETTTLNGGKDGHSGKDRVTPERLEVEAPNIGRPSDWKSGRGWDSRFGPLGPSAGGQYRSGRQLPVVSGSDQGSGGHVDLVRQHVADREKQEKQTTRQSLQQWRSSDGQSSSTLTGDGSAIQPGSGGSSKRIETPSTG